MKILGATLIATICAFGGAIVLWIFGAGALAIFIGYVFAGTVGLLGTLWVSGSSLPASLPASGLQTD